MAFPGEIGWCGKNCPEHTSTKLLTKIMRSAAGYFVATICPVCRLEDPSPNSRETHYYETREDLVEACANGTVRWRDSDFHPGPIEVEAW